MPGKQLRMPMMLETSWGRVRVARCHQSQGGDPCLIDDR
jgi:hypothetical protein